MKRAGRILKRLLQVSKNSLSYLIATSLKSWSRNWLVNSPAVGSMTMLLLLLGVTAIASWSLVSAAQVQARDALILHIYLRDDADAQTVTDFKANLERGPHVTAMSYTSKDQALDKARKRPGMNDIVGATDSNPFPASIDLHFDSLPAMRQVDADVRNSPLVDPSLPTSYDENAYLRIQSFLTGVVITAAAFLLILALVVIAVTINSVRVAVSSRKDEVEIMTLVGAPRWMVRGPFILEGVLTGMLSGIIAGAGLIGVGILVIREAKGVYLNAAPGLSRASFEMTAIMVLLAGLAMGLIAASIGVRRHLNA